MAELKVELVTIDDIAPHENAELLEVLIIGGWRVISQKGLHQVGDKVVHVPPDAMIPRELAEKWDVAKYLDWKKASTHGRVKATSIRGVVSFGFVIRESGVEEGEDLKERWDIQKYEAPEVSGTIHSGSAAKHHPMFNPNYDVENLRNHKKLFEEGEMLVVFEKIDGTNQSTCCTNVFDPDEEDVEDGLLFMIGSRSMRRKMGEEPINDYEKPLHLYPGIKPMMKEIAADFLAKNPDAPVSIIVRGEVFGPIQRLKYGRTEADWRMFDIQVFGQYLDWDEAKAYADKYGVPTVPEIARVVYDFAELEKLSSGPTIVGNGEHFREGIVCRPLKERRNYRGERAVLKIVSGEYLASKSNHGSH